MKQRACPFCGDSTASESIELSERFYGWGGCFPYLICGGCGSIYIEDGSFDVSPYYPSEYYSYAGIRPGILGYLDRRFHRAQARTHLETLRCAGAVLSPASLIYDVGSGAGTLLQTFKELGFGNVAGIDPYLRDDVDTGDVVVLRTPLEQVAETPRQRPDVIMFHHSLEHFPDPTATLTAAARLLAPNGWILVRLPVVNYAWERYGKDWFALEAPRHLAIPTPAGMARSVRRAGLRTAYVRYDSTAQQFIASNAYVRGKSFLTAFPKSPPRTLLRMATSVGYELKARSLNSRGRGDQAAFVLHREA